MRDAFFAVTVAVFSSLVSVGLFHAGAAQPMPAAPHPVIAEAAQIDAGAAISVPAPSTPVVGEIPAAASAPAAAAVPVSATVRDPLESPAGFYEDMKTAKSKGWPLVIAMGLFVALRLASRKISRLRKGRTAALVAGGVAVLGSCVDTLAMGASWTPVMVAAMGAIMLAMDPGAKIPAAPQDPAQ